jgi:hypothetical protein
VIDSSPRKTISRPIKSKHGSGILLSLLSLSSLPTWHTLSATGHDILSKTKNTEVAFHCVLWVRQRVLRSFQEIDILQCMATGYGRLLKLWELHVCLLLLLSIFLGCFMPLMAVCIICPSCLVLGLMFFLVAFARGVSLGMRVSR